MKRRKWLVLVLISGLAVVFGGGLIYSSQSFSAASQTYERPDVIQPRFEVEVLLDGRPLDQYSARGRQYVEASEGREYELRVRNPYGHRVAVALSVDGLNTIDARRTSAWQASKWVIEPYGTIDITGWQVSSSRARHFYFTTEKDSYGAKLGQTTNLGVIAAVFFREREPLPVTITPEPRRDRPYERDESTKDKSDAAADTRGSATAKSMPAPDDESAATGIGRSVGNDVRWVNLQLDSRPVSEVSIRYEFYSGLVRLGIMPRPYPRPDTLRRREDARGFEERRFSPEP